MSDLIDDAQQLEAEHLVLSLAAARATIPAGQPGECDNCGDEFPRLVGGLCGFCRDGRRPLLSTFDRLAPPVAAPVASRTGAEEKPMASPKYAAKVISAPVESKATLARIERYADQHDLPLGRAVVELAIVGLDAPQAGDTPADATSAPAEPAPVAVVSLETVPVEWLTDEIQRRLAAAADRALVDAAIARADAAEGQLATLREQLRGLVGAD